ncbi:MAG: Gx transporter family protein [Candidatus Latescibacteria bacterium]|nr:Gx transporter family protein [Candidatus Latescibacterota bacterium]
MNLGSPRQLAHLGLFSSAAIALFVFEQLVPRPLPWMRLGLGNVAVLLALLAQGPAAALAVQLTKWLVGSLLTGALGGPAFVIGGSAGLASWAAMALAHRWTGRLFSPLGLSLIGAAAHQTVQLGTAGLYIHQLGLFSLLPLSLLSALTSGAAIGLLAWWVLEKVRANGWLP